MMGKIKFGIVGCGVISDTHAKAISELKDDLELVAVCDVIEERAKKLAEKYNVKYYLDYNEMLKDDEIDAISVCTPSGMHADMAELAAEHGKHVIVEKPMDITLEQADKIVRAQEENDVVIEVIFQHRFNDSTITIKKLIDEGKFGKIQLATSYTKWYRSQEYYDSGDWRGTWALDGGGALMNQSIHYIDLMQYLVGPVDEIFAFCKTGAHERIEVEDSAVASVKFKNGAIGEIIGTTSAYPGIETKLEIFGQNASVIVLNNQIEKLYFKDSNIDNEIGNKTQSNAALGDAAIKPEGHLREYIDFVNAVKNKTSPLVTPREGRNALEIILAIYYSAVTNKPIKLPLASSVEIIEELKKLKGKGF
ncbi:Gfo/Idh/MocA family protein [Caldicellulosiruptoraceae bacterium PP1]